MNTYRITFALVVLTEPSGLPSSREIIYRGQFEFPSHNDDDADQSYIQFILEKGREEIELPSTVPTVRKSVKFDFFSFCRVNRAEEITILG